MIGALFISRFVKIMINSICIPFAFNGPSASIQGAGQLYNYYKNCSDIVYSRLFYQKYDQSAKDYLDELYNYFSIYLEDRTIVFGGNHLSVLPLHRYASQKRYYTIIFDAHRDYYEIDDGINHSNFLRYIENENRMIFGYRDKFEAHLPFEIYSINEKKTFIYRILELKKENYRFYIDIDFDVLDPLFFPATACPIKGGIGLDELIELLNIIDYNYIDYISFEEYMPIQDNGTSLDSAKKILNDIDEHWRIIS